MGIQFFQMKSHKNFSQRKKWFFFFSYWYDIIIHVSVYWFELVSQANNVAHGPFCQVSNMVHYYTCILFFLKKMAWFLRSFFLHQPSVTSHNLLIKIDFKIFKSPESLRWPLAMEWPLQWSVVQYLSSVNFFSLENIGSIFTKFDMQQL